MANFAERNKDTESTSGRQLNVTYTVTTDTSFLSISDAVDTAVAQAEADYGIEAIDAPHNRVTDDRVMVAIVMSLSQYYDYITWPGGGDPYAPRITSDRVSRIQPPQPVELDNAYAVRQKQLDTSPDSLLLNTDYLDGKLVAPGPVPIYPPQENYAETFNVPRSMMTSATFFTLSKMAHNLNQSPMMLGGVAWPAETVMLLAAAMSASQSGNGQLALSFAIGEAYSKVWTRTGHYSWGGTGTEEETMTGIKPFSKLTFDREFFQKSVDDPAREELYILYEHRVWKTSDLYTTFFGAPPP